MKILTPRKQKPDVFASIVQGFGEWRAPLEQDSNRASAAPWRNAQSGDRDATVDDRHGPRSGSPCAPAAKPLLVAGLGNPLMGGDGIGCTLAECLAVNRRLSACAEVMRDGSDPLRCAGRAAGRSRIASSDTLQNGGDSGSVLAFDGNSGLDRDRVFQEWTWNSSM